MNNINGDCEIVATRKKKIILLGSHQLFEEALDLILSKEGEEKEDSDPKNPLQF